MGKLSYYKYIKNIKNNIYKYNIIIITDISCEQHIDKYVINNYVIKCIERVLTHLHHTKK